MGERELHTGKRNCDTRECGGGPCRTEYCMCGNAFFEYDPCWVCGPQRWSAWQWDPAMLMGLA